jgi:hypothetical protein
MMDINKICIGLIFLLALGAVYGNISNNNVVYGADTWITPTAISVYMTNLYATIHVSIKNNENHVEYFKISQIYTGQGGLDTPMSWIITSKPGAVKMVDSVSPQLGGDWGWEIKPGETKEVTFQLLAVGNNSADPLKFTISNGASQPDIYWPLIPDPGLYSSWFQPNEIEMLNPNLDLKSWRGSFSFDLVNIDSQPVSGIIRAPVVPTDSKLISSNPKVTFTDKDIVMNGAIAAWNVNLGSSGSKTDSQSFLYTYVWPSSSAAASTGTFKSAPTTSSSSKTSPLSTKETGVPYGLFLVGGILTASGLAYARFKR